ncbi:hypothetical protein RhiirA4_465998 [Rhizophagus irregularis]|uniref:Uncharacterized protein n=1 Tax=Rhizophagus irregularis TaxID=588596 RepID=A0A2I1GT87_9GLOM|nr:hypothetical protein RhiirA4_465998 [Rhizophagus irregularis]
MNAVNIDSNKLVSYLHGVKADELKLWKVEIPDDRDDQLNLPVSECIHVIAKSLYQPPPQTAIHE